MRVFIVPCGIPQISAFTFPFLRDYCDRHGYALEDYAPPQEADRSPTWYKLRASPEEGNGPALLLDASVLPLPGAPPIHAALDPSRLSLLPASVSRHGVRQLKAGGFDPQAMRFNTSLIGCPPSLAAWLRRVFEAADSQGSIWNEQGAVNAALANDEVDVAELPSAWGLWLRRPVNLGTLSARAHFVRFAGSRRRSLETARALWGEAYGPGRRASRNVFPPSPADFADAAPRLLAPVAGDAERGVILYNRGTKCLVRMLVCLYSLRQWWTGPVTVFLEGPHPVELLTALEQLQIEAVFSSNPASGAYIRKVEVCFESPYARSLWLDSDTIVCGPLDEIFDALDEHEVVTPHFAGWWADSRRLKGRIRWYEGKCPQEWIEQAIGRFPAVNMGVFAVRRGAAFLEPWLELSRKGDHKAVRLPEEIAFQILYPHYSVGIIPAKFGASVKYDPGSPDIRVVHYHGQKHVHDFPLCDLWKEAFGELLEQSGSQLPALLPYADKCLRKWLAPVSDVTLVTACDRRYVEKLRITFPNWLKYKRAGLYPVLVFVHGIPLDDPVLDFLRLPNVTLRSWDLPVDSQRERMLSAFVLGTAQHVKTRWWMKLDADAYATDASPLATEAMKQYDIYGHRWGNSLSEHILALDAWAAGHPELRTEPMFDPSRVRGDKFRHPRTASYVQLQSTELTKLCAQLAGDRLPVPSHDTFLFYVADRLGRPIGRVNFKTMHGFSNCSRTRGLRERVLV